MFHSNFALQTICTCPALFSQLNISADTAVTDRLFVYQFHPTLAGEVIIQSTLVQESSTSQFTVRGVVSVTHTKVINVRSSILVEQHQWFSIVGATSGFLL